MGHGRLAPRGALLAVLAVREPGRDADLRELGVGRVPIRVRVRRPRLLALREQAGARLPGAHPLRFLPGDVVLGADSSERCNPIHLPTSGLQLFVVYSRKICSFSWSILAFRTAFPGPNHRSAQLFRVSKGSNRGRS